jgi:SAM-dependent methyltransferase
MRVFLDGSLGLPGYNIDMKDFLQTVKLLLQGHSIYRALSTATLTKNSPELSGSIVDFGSGKDPSRTLKSLKIDKNKPHKIITTDILSITGVDYKVDLNEELPFKDGQLGAAVLSNCMYALYEPQKSLLELSRTIKIGGYLILITPFIYRHTHEPVDYYRFSQDFFHRALKEANFSEVKVYPFGERFTAISYLLISSFKTNMNIILRILFFPFFVLALILDGFIPARFRTKYHSPLGFVVIAKK